MDIVKLLIGCSMLAIVFGFLAYKAKTTPPKSFAHLTEFARVGTTGRQDQERLKSTVWLARYLKGANYALHKPMARAKLDSASVYFYLTGNFGGPDVAIVCKRKQPSSTLDPCWIVDFKITYQPRVKIKNVTPQFREQIAKKLIRVWELHNRPLPSKEQLDGIVRLAERINAAAKPGRLMVLESNDELVVALFTMNVLKAEPPRMKEIAMEIASLATAEER